MAQSYRLFGLYLPVELVVGAMILFGLFLLALRLRTLLFLTLIVLLLPSLDLGTLSVLGRLLRWACLAALVVKGILSNLRLGLRPRPQTPLHTAIFVLMVLTLASSLWSIGSGLTLAQGLVMVGLWAGVFLVIWNSWESPEEILQLSDILFRIAAMVFLLQLGFLVDGLLDPSSFVHRVGGVFKNPNGLGVAVAFLGPFVYWKHRSTDHGGVKALAKLLGLVLAISLLLSGSRSGLLGTMVCMGLMLTYVHRTKVALLLALFTVPLAAVFLFGGGNWDTEGFGDARMIRSGSLESLSDRLPNWEEGFDLAMQRPVLGYGYAMSRFAVIGRANSDLYQAMLRVKGARNYHNTHLQLLLEIGFVGLAVFWYFLYTVIKAGANLYRGENWGPLELAGVAYFAAVLALIGDTVVHGWGFSPGSSMSIVFWLTSAAVLRVQMFSMQFAEEAAEETVQETTLDPQEAWAAG